MRFGDVSTLQTGSATAHAESTAVTFKITGPARIKKVKVYNFLGTGSIEYVRFDFAGIRTPQKYLMPETGALEGTEVGTGKMYQPGIDVDVDVPAGISTVDIYFTNSVASQTCLVGVEWEAN
jgi:hypothetical protein